ncbi:PglZ domain-containing protein [Halobaculum halobium]|uniref:PglZ domain-containing protein n=1 Tax=Halobaculum halobium TaxID=3032281 RepID=UPI003617CBA3
MDFLKAVNRPLAEGLGDEPRLTTPQTQFFDEYAATNEKTAIFICDGLRYELAETLRDELSYDFDHQLEAVSAALPSVTEVGMAAHLPGQLGLAVEDDELQITVDGEPTENKQSRVDRFARAGFEVADLTDILDTPLEDLQTAEPVPGSSTPESSTNSARISTTTRPSARRRPRHSGSKGNPAASLRRLRALYCHC